MDIESLIDIESLVDIKSFVEIDSLTEIDSLVGQRELRCCSTSLYILVLSCILILGFILQPDLTAL